MVTPGMLEVWKGQRIKQVSPVRVSIELCCVRAAFATAQRWGLVEKHPSRYVKKLPIDHKEPRFLRSEEIQGIPKELPAKTRPFVLIALYTAIRRGGDHAPVLVPH
jgi:hypothetical protein